LLNPNNHIEATIFMNTITTRHAVALALLALSTLNSQLSTCLAQGTAFTYQGRLNNGGGPANGLYDFQFSLSNAPSGGSQLGVTVTNLAVGVTNGLFTTTLDFGPVLAGQAAWLAISVRNNGAGSYVGLTPLQPLLPTPYAIMANSASNLLGALPVAQLSGTLQDSSLPASPNFSGTVTANAFSGGGTGLTGLNPANLSAGTAGINISGNAATATTATSANSATIAGSATSATTANNFSGALGGDVTGTQGATVVSSVGSQSAVNVASGVIAANNATHLSTPNTIVQRDGSGNFNAGTVNAVTVNGENFVGGVLSGNGANVTGVNAASLNGLGAANFWQTGGNSGTTPGGVNFLGTKDNQPLEFHVNGQRGLRLEYVTNSSFQLESVNVIGGYSGNSVSAGIFAATIAGGGDSPNDAGPNQISAILGTIGGGAGNTVSGNSGTVAGGGYNTAGYLATVSGGSGNQASGQGAMVPGGEDNTATGSGSFAAGFYAYANNDGAFVWADTHGGSFGSFASTNNDSFNVRAQGGARFVTSGKGMTVDGPVSATSFTGPASGLTGVALLAAANTFNGTQIITGGNVGIGTASPFTQLANTANNILGTDGYGLGSSSLGWYSSGVGYTAGFYDPGTGPSADGVVIGIAGTAARILDLFSGGNNSVMVVNGNGRVGIGTNAPLAQLDVNGSFRINQGTVFNRVQDGIFTAGAAGTNYNLVAGNTYYTKQVTNAFPVAFSSVPNVTVSAVSQAGTDYGDIFCVAVRRVTTTYVVVNIQRMDATTPWAQLLQVSYHAWQ
jgi:hypothetical protein